jgi:hypothetical protein
MLQILSRTVELGNETKIIEMVNPFQGPGQYQVFIDRIYQGQLAYQNGVWVNQLREYCKLCTADIDLLCEMWVEKWGV